MKIYVVGHKNPDTDSICSAIAYANLKNQISKDTYVAKRAGQLNEETQYVMKRFGIQVPELLSNVQLQIKDIDVNCMSGIMEDVSIKEAWALMKERNVHTISVVKEGKLRGIVTTGDIAMSYMDVHDESFLAQGETTYQNIADALEGEVVSGNPKDYFTSGRVVVDIEEIKAGDLAILNNPKEQLADAIERGASCVVICKNAEVEQKVQDVVMIRTPYDTFTVSRLIYQSIPVKSLMTTENLLLFRTTDYVEDVKNTMSNRRFRDFPVLDKNGDYYGLISRRRLMNSRKKQLILVDHNEKTQAIDGVGEADIIEIIDHHRLGNLETVGPVYFRNQPVGCTATIVYQMYVEHEVEVEPTMAALLCSAIISDTLLFRSPTCTIVDRRAAEELAKIAGVDMEELAQGMFQAGSNLKGKTAEEICFQDFKQFTIENITFGVGQVNSMQAAELLEIKEELLPYMEEGARKQHLDMLFLMLTNIVEETTELLCYGKGAKQQVIEAFGLPRDTEDVILDGVVSRKKQLIPTFIISLQQ